MFAYIIPFFPRPKFHSFTMAGKTLALSFPITLSTPNREARMATISPIMRQMCPFSTPVWEIPLFLQQRDSVWEPVVSILLAQVMSGMFKSVQHHSLLIPAMFQFQLGSTSRH